MPAPLRIVGINGSLRRASYNASLLAAARSLLGDDIAWTQAEIGDLPLYNRDLEVDGFPAPVVRLRRQVAEADAVLFASPEYNGSVTGAMKNAVDWLSRNPLSPLDHLPAAIIGGAGRGGSAGSQAHLREALAHNRVNVLEERQVLVPRIWDAFDDDRRLVDERVGAELQVLMTAFLAHVRRDGVRRPAVVAFGADPATLALAYRTLGADYRVFPTADGDGLGALVAAEQAAAVLTLDGVVAPEDPGVPLVAVADVATAAEALEPALRG